MIWSAFSVVGMVILVALGLALLTMALWRPSRGAAIPTSDSAWKNYRFGFVVYALIFVAFDMEMIFMYPWAVVFADIGLKAFLDMLVFIALLGGGVAYAWAMGGLEWE